MKLVITILALLVGSLPLLAEQKKLPSPTREELVGVWRPDKESMREIEKKRPNHMPPEIQLFSHGGFAFDNIPGWWRNVFGQPSMEVNRSLTGRRWEIKEGTDGPELLLEGQAPMILSIEGQKLPYFILLHIGGTPGNVPVRFYRALREAKLNSFRFEARQK